VRRYLVTGGAGFIGSHIAASLLDRGTSVRILDDFSSGRRENLAPLRGGNTSGRLEVIEADLCDTARVAEAVIGIDVVFHEAAFVSVPQSIDQPHRCLEVNIGGTSTLFDAAQKAGVQRIVVASSAAVYGDSKELPLTEELSPAPVSPYAVSKSVDEMLAALYTRAFGLEVVALRYFNVYGPRQRPDSMYAAAVPIFIRGLLDRRPATIFGDGRQTRDLVFVDDVVRANLQAADHPDAPGNIFNICTGKPTSVLELLRVLKSLVPGSPEPEFAPARTGDIYDSLGSPARAERVMGFRAATPLEEGLRATIRWMQ
jgi:nucleoside-diphosphate-sugar epimerase